MSTFRISEQALAVLRSHGWRSGRQADLGEIAAYLKSENIELSPVAAEFLRDFGGLHLQLPNGGLSAVNFDVHDEMTYLEDGELARFESLVGQPLCPVGVGGRFLLFITPTGEVFFLHDEWLLYLRARNVHDAFEVICTQGFKGHETIMLSEDQKPAAFRDAS